ncbi:MAG TPA: hypothetical protein EYM84_06840 [Flavobacteriales bacterium]|nr:hypothetical protein [Flavobacteriales bacterium]HIN39971.1 hypothetical protein [Flavobacteriales bacterium]
MKLVRVNQLLLGLVIIGATTLTSCKKEGCTDLDSTTYNSSAKKDDGTCQFEGRSVFWYGLTASDGLVNDGATNLTFYVDGQVVGSTATSVYWTASPDCGVNASITVTKDLGGVKTQSYSYRVIDQSGFEYWGGTLNFNANTCFGTELTW